MTIKIINVHTADNAFLELEKLCKNGHIYFRGHQNFRWRLQSTLLRHHIAPPSRLTTHDLDTMINHFVVNLKSLGVSLPFDRNDRRGCLEYSRHYGVPSPLIDFSRSPYVALFFAFNGVRPHEAKPKDKAAIYCLNAHELAGIWTHLKFDRSSPNAGVQLTSLHVVEGGDHSLLVSKTELKARGLDQAQVDHAISESIAAFVRQN